MKSIKFLLPTLATILIGILGSACNDENNAAGPTGKLMVVNAAPATGEAIGFTLNDMKANVSALGYGANSGYVTVKNGTYDMKILKADQDAIYHDAKLSIESGRYFSVYLYGTESLKAFKVEDIIPTEASAQARVRFFNFVENVPAVNLAAVSDVALSPIFADRAMETTAASVQHASFMNVDAGALQITLTTELSEDFLVEAQPIDLKAGGSYTIIASGAVGSTDYPVKLWTIKNK